MLSKRKSEDVEKMDVDNDFELNDTFVNNSSIFFHSFPENTQNTTKKLFYFPLFSSNLFFFPQQFRHRVCQPRRRCKENCGHPL